MAFSKSNGGRLCGKQVIPYLPLQKEIGLRCCLNSEVINSAHNELTHLFSYRFPVAPDSNLKATDFLKRNFIEFHCDFHDKSPEKCYVFHENYPPVKLFHIPLVTPAVGNFYKKDVIPGCFKHVHKIPSNVQYSSICLVHSVLCPHEIKSRARGKFPL